jgi:exopolyphosphatase / guanosine-5'-triphosphate,3'-diphosphate pyrophosphatase
LIGSLFVACYGSSLINIGITNTTGSTMSKMEEGSLVAAVDLGSNSFRMEIGRFEHGAIVRVDYLKETVRQGAGLDDQRNLTMDSMQRGWETLARFGERLHGFCASQVRAVATQTLREARNRDLFINKAQQMLGFPIEVIAGREEARLIYQGVAHALGGNDEKRLVMDIGGRSTELILGQGLAAKQLESYRVGSVAWADKHLAHGQLDAQSIDQAIVAAKAVLDEAVPRFGQGWSQAYGSAGTIGAISDILHAQGHKEDVIELQGLLWLRGQLIAAGSVDRLELPALKDDRKPVLGGGLAILIALFELLGLQQVRSVDAGLRHGVLYDLLDRDSVATDIRSQSVQRLGKRFETDAHQAQRVGQVAVQFFEQLQMSASDSPELRQRHARKLNWAAQLHEIGALISHSDCHKHSAYIIDNADVAGFTQGELHRLSLLVLGHKGKLRKLEADFSDTPFVQQLICLRLAVLLCHARVPPHLKGFDLSCAAHQNRFVLSVPSSWSGRYPQSMHLLQQEIQAWSKTTWALDLLPQ